MGGYGTSISVLTTIIIISDQYGPRKNIKIDGVLELAYITVYPGKAGRKFSSVGGRRYKNMISPEGIRWANG